MNITFPEQLPISQRRDKVEQLIKNNQVVIVAGETGSGKTTQIPKICLKLGLAEHGQIAHTQPRRIAARSVAERIASELQTPLGQGVGYQVRFTDVSSKHTAIKLMTDGVLLQEIQRDANLRKYSTIIIDEAHERSLNIDFLLGLLKPLCQRRPELKLIITSATIDLERFAEHFIANGRPAPVIEVSGRTYPVDILYRDEEDQKFDLATQIAQTLEDLIEGEARGDFRANGDVLVFCSGEREIREAKEAILASKLNVATLPLFARLSLAEQHKVFQPQKKRKVVLATNVAETSLTVPGIGYVIDPGMARISRYSFRSKIQRLPIEAISQASAKQRSGRSGRIANGVCVRLYSEQDFAQRPKFTQAEILRSNLAAVILRMLRLGIKDVYGFDFLDQPDRRLLNDGFKLLQELGAIDQQNKLNKVGRQMSDLSIDPKYARVLIEANKLGCLNDAIVLVSGLSVQDPRERPAEAKAAAEQMHAHLRHSKSDFMSMLQLWQAIEDAKASLSNAKFREFCRARFWSIARVFEWRELVGQLMRQCKSLKWSVSSWRPLELPYQSSAKASIDDLNNKVKNKAYKADIDDRYTLLHRAALSGLISHIARKGIDGDYQGARAPKLSIFPASTVAKTKPAWLLSAELIETSRLFAHHNAQIKAQWIAQAAPHLCRYNYSEPYYHKKSGSVKANRKTLVFGLIVRDREAVNYWSINQPESRLIFIQQALVDQDYQPHGKKAEFVAHNQKLISDIEKLETKTRKRNLLISDQQLFEFYAARLPTDIASRHALETWLSKGNQDVLKLQEYQIINHAIDASQIAQFPDQMEVSAKPLQLLYRFRPGEPGDGVTLVLPITLLEHFPAARGDWLVPGLLQEKCVALIKTLAKPIRRQFAPAAASIDRVYPKLQNADPNTSLNKTLAQILFGEIGVKVVAEDFAVEKLNDYYRLNYRLVDVDGSLIEESRDLIKLKSDYRQAVKQSIIQNESPERQAFEKLAMQDWDCGDIPETFDYSHAGMTVRAYPALRSRGQHFDLCLSESLTKANYLIHQANIDLALKRLSKSQSAKYLGETLLPSKDQGKQGLSALAKQLQTSNLKSEERHHWRTELMRAALKEQLFDTASISNEQVIRAEREFNQALERVQKKWVACTIEWEGIWDTALDLQQQLLKMLNGKQAANVEQDLALEDMKSQLYRLFEPQRLRQLELLQVKQYPRFLKAIKLRLENNKTDLSLHTKQQEFNDLIDVLTLNASLEEVYFSKPALLAYEFMLEEWRISLFAQQLKTRFPISEKRLNKFWQERQFDKLKEI